jgi:hypothetical protein
MIARCANALRRTISGHVRTPTVERAGQQPFIRRLERWMVGLVMGAIVFIIEKIVLRSIGQGQRPSRELSVAEQATKSPTRKLAP